MALSLFDIFKIGVGPSSSHTMGPMLAAARFVAALGPDLDAVAQVRVEVYGSLALTGVGHGTDRAILVGLEGALPDQIEPDAMDQAVARIRDSRMVNLGGTKAIPFDPATDLILERKIRLPYHTNGMKFSAFDGAGHVLREEIFYSVGGGFVVTAAEAAQNAPAGDEVPVPYPFTSGDEMLAIGREQGKTIAEMVMANEQALHSEQEIRDRLDLVWRTMEAAIDRGTHTEGVLPGGLKVKRRAAPVFRKLVERQERALRDPMAVMDWVNLWALAVNEENAAGGRVVTAPTNGAAGIIPAVLRYYERFCNSSPQGIHDFLLVATAIAGLFKRNASISGAEVGCQGEVGVASSMAAAGLTAALGGSNEQVENAAEIAMEHNLGLTCDPIGGLVQIPCIERNAMGAIKAIDASRLALMGDGTHFVSLDKVIATMRQTGADMSDKYKETSTGGLAVNIPAC